ncbi:MAG: replicative DNA helicase [Aquificae bacterium]|nr:replicative DNA helicase [Aquificota bacterium]
MNLPDLKLPADEGAERAVLGSMLEDPENNVPTVMEILREEDFFVEEHRLLFRVIHELWNERGGKWDFIILRDYIKRKGLEKQLPEDWLKELYAEAVDAELLEEACRIVKEKAGQRAIIELGIELIHKGKEARDFNALIEEAQQKIFAIAEGTAPVQIYHVKDVAEQVIELIKRFRETERIVTGLPTGFIELDYKTTGLHPGELVVVAARPGMGKTAFMLSIACNVARDEGKPVAIFSLEMSKEQLVMRMLSMIAEVSLRKIRSGQLSDEDMEKIMGAVMELSRYEIYIDDTPALTTTELKIRARKLKKERQVELVAVDYLQLLRSPVRKHSRQEEVAEVSRSLKALAKEISVPVIALAQLSREVEKRTDKRPQLADLRESGQIEQDADIILFLHRPEKYRKVPPDQKGITEVIIAKQRQGPTDTIKLAYLEEFTKFSNLEEAPPSEESVDELLAQEEEEVSGIDF